MAFAALNSNKAVKWTLRLLFVDAKELLDVVFPVINSSHTKPTKQTNINNCRTYVLGRNKYYFSNSSMDMMSDLVKNPRVMKKVQQEVRSVVGRTTKIDTDDIKEIDYLKCVIKETLRLHAPSSFFTPRETTEDVKIGGYHVPAKTRVLINVWAIPRDESVRDRAKDFIPERFENSSIDYEGSDFELVPFGVGRRGCPALKFGVAGVEYVAVNLLYWFDRKLTGDGALPVDLDMRVKFMHGFTISRKFPLHLTPISYSTYQSVVVRYLILSV